MSPTAENPQKKKKGEGENKTKKKEKKKHNRNPNLNTEQQTLLQSNRLYYMEPTERIFLKNKF